MKQLFMFAGLALVKMSVYAQSFIGMSESNFSGVHGMDVNPASIADSRYAVDVSLFSYSFSAYNNYLYFNPHRMPYGWKESFNQTNPVSTAWSQNPNFGTIYGSDSATYFQSNGIGDLFLFDNSKGRDARAFVNSDLTLLSTMITLPNQMAIGFQLKNRVMVNVDHIAPELITLASNDLEYPDLWNLDLSDQLLNVSANAWNEYNLVFAKVIQDDGEHFFKVGAKMKFLQGIASAYVYTDDVKYNFMNGDTANSIEGQFSYGYSANIADIVEPLDVNNPFEFSPGSVLDLQSRLGLGFDFGGVYEWRPNHSDYRYDMDGETNMWMNHKNKYKLRASLSINDIGGMRYSKGQLSKNFNMDVDLFDLGVFNGVSGFKSFDSTLVTLENEGKIERISDKGTYYMNLPTHITGGVNYHIWKDFYADAGFLVGFQRNKDASKVRYPSRFAITPRYDHKWFGVSTPISITGVAGLRTGLGLRMGPLVLGTDDLKPFVSAGKNKKINGANLFIALKVPVYRGHPKDDDLDKVSNKLDECPDVAGVWEFKGCPDTDKDGIKDIEDECPLVPGLAEFRGCPDSDGDKIIDKNDSCPDIAGLVYFNGCPDKDNDSIVDHLDRCPEIAGLKEFEGCPDTDLDGIKDSEDLCPEVAGPIENQGCPDKDNDGIFDYLDNCPEKAGPEENNGCPWPDTDNDGLLDKDDECPNNAGPKENNGCPYADTDGDGVLDKDDDCVNTPGPVENNGCPEIKEEEQEILNTAFENLEFQSGKAIIKEVSFASLEELAELLIKKSDWKLQIAGHTDDVGKAQTNLILSKKRSESVRDFLNQRGVEEERIIVQFFGEERPIADNDTEEGRQKNRRVEMTVLFE